MIAVKDIVDQSRVVWEGSMPVRCQIYLLVLIAIVCVVPVIGTGAAAASNVNDTYDPLFQWETLFQVSTLGALLAGHYDGVMDIGMLKTHGNLGIGTFDALDGEMIGFDGVFYQIKADGVAYPVPDSMETPFACVTFFEPDLLESLPSGMDYEALSAYLTNVLPAKNIFYAIRLDGAFSYMKTRSVPAQQKPYPPLSQVTAHQPVFEFSDVEGTVVGFRCPDYVTEINVSGDHLHFLTSDGKAGGHVLAFTIEKALLSVDNTTTFFVVLPPQNGDPNNPDPANNAQAEREKTDK